MTKRFNSDPSKTPLPDSQRCEFNQSDGSRCKNKALYWVLYDDNRIHCCTVDWRNWNGRLIRYNTGARIDGGIFKP